MRVAPLCFTSVLVAQNLIGCGSGSYRLGGGGVEVSGGALYWADYAYGGSVHRTDLVTRTSGLFHAGGGARLRAVGNNLWFSPLSNQNAIVRAPLAGGSSSAYPFANNTTFFESDGAHLYWYWDGLTRLNVTTGALKVVANLEIANAAVVATTRDWVFVSDSSSAGGIFRVAKPAP